MTALPRMPCHVNQGNALCTTLRPPHSCGGSRACNCNHGLFAWHARYACGRFVKAFSAPFKKVYIRHNHRSDWGYRRAAMTWAFRRRG